MAKKKTTTTTRRRQPLVVPLDVALKVVDGCSIPDAIAQKFPNGIPVTAEAFMELDLSNDQVYYEDFRPQVLIAAQSLYKKAEREHKKIELPTVLQKRLGILDDVDGGGSFAYLVEEMESRGYDDAWAHALAVRPSGNKELDEEAVRIAGPHNPLKRPYANDLDYTTAQLEVLADVINFLFPKVYPRTANGHKKAASRRKARK